MIQRLQTLFLLVFCITNAASYFLFPVEHTLLNNVVGAQATLLTHLPLGCALIIFINIFLFNHRKRQLLINRLVGVVFSLYWGSLVCFIVQQEQNFNHFLADLSLAITGVIVLLLANRYIAKDEALVRSLDRLR